MANFYAKQCENKGYNFFKVPLKWSEKTREIIESDGYHITDEGEVLPND